MMKQTDFTFADAKKIAIDRLSALASFAENLDSTFPTQGFLEWAIKLHMIEEKIKKASARCLLGSEINQISIFGGTLINFRVDLKPKLSALWALYHEVLHILVATKSIEGYHLQKIITKLTERIEQTDELAGKVTTEVIRNPSNILSATSLLLVHVIRTESIENAITKQLEDAVMTFNLQDKYDIIDMCSVQFKVAKGKTKANKTKWYTDVRAIRNATAHGHFQIHMLNNNDWSIEFNDNEKEGYNFHKTFSREEFQRFFDQHSLLYKFQFHLWMVLELLPLLATHLHEQT